MGPEPIFHPLARSCGFSTGVGREHIIVASCKALALRERADSMPEALEEREGPSYLCRSGAASSC